METEAYLKLMLITVGLMAIAFAAMAIRILIKKKGKFISLHLSGNKEMKKKGITCATSTMKRDELTYKAIKI
ncbi:MAG: hypothetical protein WBG43_06880 [Marinifilaceae bacterium]|jgi:hypothetical protein